MKDISSANSDLPILVILPLPSLKLFLSASGCRLEPKGLRKLK